MSVGYSLSNFSVSKYVSSNSSGGIRTRQVSLPALIEAEKKEEAGHSAELELKEVNVVRLTLDELYDLQDFEFKGEEDDIEDRLAVLFENARLNRRELSSIALSEDKSFSKIEKMAAKRAMENQEKEIIEDDDLSPAETYAKLITFLDSATSGTERETWDWAVKRGRAQAEYLRLTESADEDLLSRDPIVMLLEKAHAELLLDKQSEPDSKIENTEAFLRAQFKWEQQFSNYSEYTTPYEW